LGKSYEYIYAQRSSYWMTWRNREDSRTWKSKY